MVVLLLALLAWPTLTPRSALHAQTRATGPIIKTVAGTDTGPATLFPLSSPNGVAVDAAGNIYVAETGQAPDPEDRRGHRRHLDDCGRRL